MPDIEPTVISGCVVSPAEILEKVSKQFDLLVEDYAAAQECLSNQASEITKLKADIDRILKIGAEHEKRYRRVEQKVFDLPDAIGLGEGGLG